MKWQQLGMIGIVILMMAPEAASAQGDIKNKLGHLIEKVGVHANTSFRAPMDSDVTKGWTSGVSVGLSPGRRGGWKFPASFTTFSEDLHSANGTTFATAHTRALLGGVGYGWHVGQLATGVQLQAGYAFNWADGLGDMQQAFAAPSASVDIANAWLLRPQVKAEYFLTPKFTVRTAVGYVRMRPDVVVTTGDLTMANERDLSHAHANVGIGWDPFWK